MVTNTVELRKAMIDCNINSVKELSEKSGINRNTLAQVLNGKIQPSANVMEQLVLVLNIDPSTAGQIFFTPNLRRK